MLFGGVGNKMRLFEGILRDKNGGGPVINLALEILRIRQIAINVKFLMIRQALWKISHIF